MSNYNKFPGPPEQNVPPEYYKKEQRYGPQHGPSYVSSGPGISRSNSRNGDSNNSNNSAPLLSPTSPPVHDLISFYDGRDTRSYGPNMGAPNSNALSNYSPYNDHNAHFFGHGAGYNSSNAPKPVPNYHSDDLNAQYFSSNAHQYNGRNSEHNPLYNGPIAPNTVPGAHNTGPGANNIVPGTGNNPYGAPNTVPGAYNTGAQNNVPGARYDDVPGVRNNVPGDPYRDASGARNNVPGARYDDVPGARNNYVPGARNNVPGDPYRDASGARNNVPGARYDDVPGTRNNVPGARYDDVNRPRSNDVTGARYNNVSGPRDGTRPQSSPSPPPPPRQAGHPTSAAQKNNYRGEGQHQHQFPDQQHPRCRDGSAGLPRHALPPPPPSSPQIEQGRELCGLPNLGNSCYLNTVLQCLYHIPSLPPLLAKAVEERGFEGNSVGVAASLVSLMAKMDTNHVLKREVMEDFKELCGQRDARFAGKDQQEAHDLMAGLVLWLHQDLSSKDELDCACTKRISVREYTNATAAPQSYEEPQKTQPSRYPHSDPPPREHHDMYARGNNYNDRIHGRKPLRSDNNMDRASATHTPSQHRDRDRQQQQTHTGNTDNNEPSQASRNSKKEGEECGKCKVTYQRRSLISDLFEGIQRQDIICPKKAFILHSTYERFTSLSLHITGSSEITLEEAIKRYFRKSIFDWDCMLCNRTHECRQESQIVVAPPILAIHFSRYTNIYNPTKQRIHFPTDLLSLKEHMQSPHERTDERYYCLRGVCRHHGTMSRGHYTATCNTRKGWYIMDDKELKEKVMRCSRTPTR